MRISDTQWRFCKITKQLLNFAINRGFLLKLISWTKILYNYLTTNTAWNILYFIWHYNTSQGEILITFSTLLINLSSNGFLRYPSSHSFLHFLCIIFIGDEKGEFYIKELALNKRLSSEQKWSELWTKECALNKSDFE